MTFSRFCLITIALFSLLSCDSKVERDVLPGTYIGNIPGRPETMVIRSDGTYTHTFNSKEEEGVWEFGEMEQRDGRITFRNFTTRKGNGLFIPAIETRFDETFLIISYDLDYYFKKQ